MSKFKFLISVLIVILVFSVLAIFSFSNLKAENNLRKIVVFDEKVVNEKAKDVLLNKFGAIKVKNLGLINGAVVVLPDKASERALLKNPEVKRIDDDVMVYAFALRSFGHKAKIQPPQVLTWNIDRVDAEKVFSINTGNGIKVGVIDTGIDISHPDLVSNLKGGVSAVNYTSSYKDDNGHGTHVAGIIAALNNTIGVIGVGPNISLYAIKVLDRRGSGYLSDVIEGIDWAIQNGMQVINMSLGTSSNIQSFYEAVLRAYNAGIVVVAAAGNSGGSVSFPAAYPEVIAVSATDENNNITSWSSRGPEIDLAAPGNNIYSTYKGSAYKTLSGTSMAAPHVSGVAALILKTLPGVYDLDNDGIWDPNEVEKKLKDSAVDLGDVGCDNLYGCGLVNAYNAIQ